MAIKKYLITLLSTTIVALSSEIAIAADGTSNDSSFAGWPLLALFAAVIIFRKKLFAEATAHPPESDHQETAVPEVAVPEIVAEKVQETVKKPATKPVKKPAKKAAAKTKAEETSNNVDLTNGGNQCQASTAKGTRCKRTTSLENASVKIDNTTYQLTVCKQHNNKSIKPFSELLK
jgi:hypothetical protein